MIKYLVRKLSKTNLLIVGTDPYQDSSYFNTILGESQKLINSLLHKTLSLHSTISKKPQKQIKPHNKKNAQYLKFSNQQKQKFVNPSKSKETKQSKPRQTQSQKFSQNKKKQSNQRNQQNQQNQQQFQQKNLKIINLNKEIQIYIQQNIADLFLNNQKTLTSLSSHSQSVFPLSQSQQIMSYDAKIRQQKQKIQHKESKLCFLQLSNLYKFIVIKCQHLSINPYESISLQNKKTIYNLILSKNRQQLNTLFKSNQTISLLKHQQFWDSIYLAVMVSSKGIPKTTKSEIIMYIQALPCQDLHTEGKNQRYCLQFLHLNQQKTNFYDFASMIKLPINLSNVFLPHIIMSSDNFAFQFLKSILQYRTAQEAIQAIKALAKVITAKQLRSLDALLQDLYLLRTQKYYLFQQNLTHDQNYSTDQQKKRVLTIKQIGSLSSILSQLSLKGNSIEICQRIFSFALYKEAQLLGSIIQTISKLLPSKQISIDQIQKLGIPSMKFDEILKFFIAFTQIGVIDRDFQYLFQKIFIQKLKIRDILRSEIRDILGNGKEEEGKRNPSKIIQQRFNISEKEVSILVIILHKFKKGTRAILLKSKSTTFNSHQQPHCPYHNIWISIYRFYRSKLMIPDQFIFPILSGVYRSYSSIILNLMNDINNKRVPQQLRLIVTRNINQIVKLLLRKLYDADKELSYLEDLNLEKLIQFIIVFQQGILQTFLATLDWQLTTGSENLKQKNNHKILCQFYIQFIDKTITKIDIRKNKIIKQNFSNQLNLSNEIKLHDKNNNFSKEFQQSKRNLKQIHLNKKQMKQKQDIFQILQFYLIYVKLNVSLLIENHLEEQKSLNIQKLIFPLRDRLKKIKLTEDISCLINLMIQNSKQLSQNLNQDNSKSTKIIQSSLDIFIDKFQAFIGYHSQNQLEGYERQLHSSLFQSIFPDLANDQELMLEQSSKLLETMNRKSFKRQKFLLNHIQIVEELIRVKLISSEQDFSQYEDARGINQIE